MKRKRRKRKTSRLILSIFLVVFLLSVIAVVGFRTKKIQVTGNSYYGENSVITWISQDKLSANSLYLFLKYNFTDASLPSGIEELKISFRSPWSIQVRVKEKAMIGYIDYDQAYLYFDKEGIACLRTKRVIEGVPHIQGMEVDVSKVKIGKSLPAADKKIFQKIVEVSKYLEKYKLDPDSISCPDGEIQLTFGIVIVQLGEKEYEDKIAQISPILAKLAEQYPEQAGTLHLENYDTSNTAVRFVPEAADGE